MPNPSLCDQRKWLKMATDKHACRRATFDGFEVLREEQICRLSDTNRAVLQQHRMAHSRGHRGHCYGKAEGAEWTSDRARMSLV